MAEAPGPNETLSPDDAGKILEELLDAQNHANLLGLKMNVRPSDVEAIQATYQQPKDRLFHIILAFLRQAEPRPTWRVIVDALKSPMVGLTALATTVEAAHIPDPTLTRDVVPETTDTESVTNTIITGDDEVKSKPPSQLHPTTGAVKAVRAQIKSLHKRFNSLKEKTIKGLERCRIKVIKVVYILTTILTVQEHGFLEKKQKSLNKSSNHWELFGRLNFYWNYLSHDLLEHLVEELASKHNWFRKVSGEMAVYKKDLEEFRKRTTLVLFCKADPRTLDEDPPPHFRKMVVKFDWTETATLEDLEEFRRRCISSYNLQTCVMMLNSIKIGSFTVTWFIPALAVEMLMKDIDLAVVILEEFSVTRLEIHTSTPICVYPAKLRKRATLTSASNNSGTTAIKSKEPGQASAQDEKYQFAEQPSDDFFCPVTMDLLLQPHLTSCCGNHLSQEAAIRIQREGWACPVCKEQSWSTMLNKHFQRQVNSLRVFCCHVDRGCGWHGDLAVFHDHVMSCPMKDGPLMSELAKLQVYGDGASHHKTMRASGPTTKNRLAQLGQQARALVRRSTSSAQKRSGVAGLYVDTNYIYYSCTEINEGTNEKKYVLKKCKEDGRVVSNTFESKFFIRGIGENKGFLYILCSAADSQVLKLNKHLKVVKRSSDTCGRYFGEAFGMLITSNNVLVCSERNTRISVLDLNLEFYCNFELDFGPISITKFQNHFIVTSKTAIEVMDIDFAKKTFKINAKFKSFIKGEDTILFKQNVALRSICASDRYLYVTQKENDGPGWPMLCLEYDEKRCKLNYVCEVNDFQAKNCNKCTIRCGPVVVVCYNNNTIFYSQGSYGEKFHIVKATHNPGEPIKSIKMFDVQ